MELRQIPVAASFVLAASLAGADTFTVRVESFIFDADNNDGTAVDTLEIDAGDTVQWVWVAGDHTVTSGESSNPADNPGALFDQDLNAGQPTFEFTFTDPGTYPYFCRHHELFGMKGVIEVRSVDDGDRDDDGIDDAWEELYGLDPDDPLDALEDPDSDGLTNLEEFTEGTEPDASDSDGDTFWDGAEVEHGSDPLDGNSVPADSGVVNDINLDGTVNALDVQLSINGALGIGTPYPSDVNGDDVVNAVDVQRVINSALGVT